MTAKPPVSQDNEGEQEDDDPSVRLLDALAEDAALDAAANPGPPSDAARALSRFARARFLGRDVGREDGAVQSLGSENGELDTARITAMDRAQLVDALSRLRDSRGEPGEASDEEATDEQLRGAVRSLRPSPAGRP